MTPEEIIKKRYPFYDPDIYGKNIEINAEAAIELMQEYAEQYATQREGWISVEDRLPEIGQVVDLWVVNTHDEEKSFRQTRHKFDGEFPVVSGRLVTHWLHYHSPPKSNP